jgi:hypothetical protein
MDGRRLGRLVLGLASTAVAIGYLVSASDMPQGTLASPGPGMFPVGVGCVWGLASVVVVLEAVLSKQNAGGLDLPRGFELRQAVVFMGTLVGFIAVLPFLGFVISASLYATVSLRLLGSYSWIRAGVYGVAMGIGTALLFGDVLALPLPAPGL